MKSLRIQKKSIKVGLENIMNIKNFLIPSFQNAKN